MVENMAHTKDGKEIKKAVALFFECDNRNGFYTYGVPGVISLRNGLDVAGYVDGKCFSSTKKSIARKEFWEWWKEYCIEEFCDTVFLGSVRVEGCREVNGNYIVSA